MRHGQAESIFELRNDVQ